MIANIYLCEKVREMRTTAVNRKQAIIRFDDDLMAWLTNQARLENKSFNAYMTEMAQERREKVMAMSAIRIPTEISPKIFELRGSLGTIPEEKIKRDPRLAHAFAYEKD